MICQNIEGCYISYTAHYLFVAKQATQLDLTSRTDNGLVDIEIAGVSKRFEVNYQISVDAEKSIHRLGSRDVNFSDFNLIPPRKLGGMIKTNDKLSVAFHLKINPLYPKS